MLLPLGLPSQLSSLLLFLTVNTKKATKTSHKKFSEGKPMHVGWKPEKPTKLDGKYTTTLSHHLYILCHFADYAHHKTTCT